MLRHPRCSPRISSVGGPQSTLLLEISGLLWLLLSRLHSELSLDFQEMLTVCFLQQRREERVGSGERALLGATPDGCLPPAQLLAGGEKPHQLLLRDLPKAK